MYRRNIKFYQNCSGIVENRFTGFNVGTRGGNIILEKLIFYGLGNIGAMFLLKESLYMLYIDC